MDMFRLWFFFFSFKKKIKTAGPHRAVVSIVLCFIFGSVSSMFRQCVGDLLHFHSYGRWLTIHSGFFFHRVEVRTGAASKKKNIIDKKCTLPWLRTWRNSSLYSCSVSRSCFTSSSVSCRRATLDCKLLTSSSRGTGSNFMTQNRRRENRWTSAVLSSFQTKSNQLKMINRDLFHWFKTKVHLQMSRFWILKKNDVSGNIFTSFVAARVDRLADDESIH